MESIWRQDTEPPLFDELKKDITTDVLIIGGGIAGLLCAYKMQESGIDCVVVEAERICSGITGNTTAKITCQHGLIYNKIIERYGTDRGRLYMEAQQEAVEDYKKLCKIIPCDFEEADSYIYSLNNPKIIRKEADALKKIGCKALVYDKLPLPFDISGAIGLEKQYCFHPLKLLFALAKKLNIYEKTKVTDITSQGAITLKAKIKAKKIVVATHFPFLNKHGSYFMKMYQHRSYVIAYENAPLLKGMYADEDDKGMSFRNYNGLLLVGGGGHRTGKKGGNWEEITEFMKRNYPSAREVCRFATQDCMTLDGIPYIGQYSMNTPGLYVATGFNKWGMTSSMAAAGILTDLVREKENKYSSVFSPSRSIIHPQLAINAFESVAGLLRPTAPRCPHMGCALKYNPCEHSWDCSCHGSRFDEDGKMINNPSNKNLTKF